MPASSNPRRIPPMAAIFRDRPPKFSGLLFESDPSVIDGNVRETKLSSPDYIDTDSATALRDFRARIAHYESVYSSLEDRDGSWIRSD